MNFMMAFDFLLLALGAYLVYAAISMKSSGNIPNSIVPSQTLVTCRDVKGYANYLFPWVAAFAVACFLFGLVSLGLDLGVLQLGKLNSVINMVSVFVFMGMWIAFSVVLRKGQKKFF